MRINRHLWHLLIVISFVLMGRQTSAVASGPENLLLVVNSESKDSISIANHYAMLRNIPDRNVVMLDSVPTRQGVSVEDFKSKILEPIINEIKKRNLQSQIDLIVYSAGFPTGIRLDEESLKKVVPKENLKYFKPMASINAATYFAQHVLNDRVSFVSPNANFYFRRNATEVARFNPFGGKDRETFADIQAAYADKSFGDALKLARSLIREDRPRPLIRYWSAKCLAQLGQIDESIRALDQAVSDGWNFAKWTQSLKDFEPLRKRKEFDKVIARMTESDRTSVSSFSNSTIWRPDGFRTSNESEGQRYYLSMVLGVSRGKGNTANEIISSLQASSAVDNTHPKGTFYFVSNNRIRARTRANLIPEAVKALEGLGLSTETINSTLPENKSDVLGLTMGTAKFDFAKSGSKIVPGAICENLTSSGGKMTGKPGTGQTTVAEFVKHGAAGSSGTVIEPYTIAKKFPHPMIHYYYARGCNLAEAFYQSVHGPYQLLIVGDPLCRPFGKDLEFEVTGISESGTVSGQLDISIHSDSKYPIESFDLYYDDVLVRSAGVNESIAFDSSKTKDGYHEFRVVAKSTGPIVFSSTRILDVFIRNHGKLPKITAKAERLQPGDSLKVELSEPIDAKLIARKFGKELESSPIRAKPETSNRLKGISIPCSQLGSGPSRIKIFAQRNSTELCLGSATVNVKDKDK